MSHPLEKMEKFVELRAAGEAFDGISRKLGVAKSTLIEWSKKFKPQLKEAEDSRIDHLRRKFSVSQVRRIENLGSFYTKIQKEIMSRELKNIPTERLLDLALKFQAALKLEDAHANTEDAPVKLRCSNCSDFNPWKFDD